MSSNVVTRGEIAAAQRAISNTAAAAKAGFAKEVGPFVSAFLNAGGEEQRAPYRDKITAITYSRIERFRQVMAQRSADIRATAGDDVYVGIEPYPYEAVDGRVRSAATDLFKTGDVDGYIARLSSYIEEEVNDGRFEGW